MLTHTWTRVVGISIVYMYMCTHVYTLCNPHTYMYMYIIPDVPVHAHVHDTPTQHTYTHCSHMYICHVYSTLHVQSTGSRRGRKTQPNHTHNAKAHPHDEEGHSGAQPGELGRWVTNSPHTPTHNSITP